MSTKYLKDDGIILIKQELRTLRARLEDCKVDELVSLQTQIKTLRSLLEAEETDKLITEEF